MVFLPKISTSYQMTPPGVTSTAATFLLWRQTCEPALTSESALALLPASVSQFNLFTQHISMHLCGFLKTYTVHLFHHSTVVVNASCGRQAHTCQQPLSY